MRWAALATIAALPLQWFVVAGAAGSAPRLHQLVLIFFTLLVMLRYHPRAFAPLLRASRLLVLANMFMLVTLSVIYLYRAQLPFGPVEEIVYLAAFVAVGTYLYRSAVGLEPEALALLRWSGPVTVLTLLVAMSLSMLTNGVNPLQVFGQSVATADPRILQDGIFKSSFTGFGFDNETVRGNLRHQVFGALLVSMYISSWATRLHPLTGRGWQRAYRGFMVTAVVLLALSLSRSIIIAALLWPLVTFLRSALSLRLSLRQVASAVAVGVLTAAAVVSGFGLVLWNRFTEDTGSYNAREATLSQVPDRIRQSFWIGGDGAGAGESTHNFVFDAWLRGGILVALAATVIVLLLVGVWVVLLSRIHMEPDWMVPVIAALGLPIVRMMTQGGGQVGVVEWVALAFVAGVLAFRQRDGGSGDNSMTREVKTMGPGGDVSPLSRGAG